MKYVHLENNKILGYYSKDINPLIPEGCLELTEKQWQEAININANCYEDGKFIVKDFRTAEEVKQGEISKWKSERDIKVQNIEVTYKDVVYQGDEKSQDRMSRHINALPNTEVTTMWVAKDNSVQILNKEDLQNILLLAGAEMSKIWIEGRPDGF